MSSQSNFETLVNLIDNTNKTYLSQFGQIRTLYESFDPNASLLTDQHMKQYETSKSDLEKRIVAISSISKLELSDILKLAFQMYSLLEDIQKPLKMMRASLNDVNIQSSLSSSEFSHLNHNMEVLKLAYEKYQREFHNLIKTTTDQLLHEIFEGVDNMNDISQMESIYEKYPVVSFYIQLIEYVLKHYKAPSLLKNIEVLKDQLLGTAENPKHEHIWRSYQSYDLMPDGPFRPLKDLIETLGYKETDLEKLSKKISTHDNKFVFIILINPGNITYNPWNIADMNYMKTHNMFVDPANGVNAETLNTFQTIETLESSKSLKTSKRSMKFIPNVKSEKRDINLKYYVLETPDEKIYRLLTPWSAFPGTSDVKYIPQNWLPGIENPNTLTQMYPSARISTYNSIIETEILSHKKEVGEIKLETRLVVKEQGEIVDKCSGWFESTTKNKFPTSLTDYRELINGDDFRSAVGDFIFNILIKMYSTQKLTVMGISHTLARRISREILGVTTKTSQIRNLFDTYKEEPLKSELINVFKQHIRQAVEIVISNNSLCSVLDKKEIMDLD